MDYSLFIYNPIKKENYGIKVAGEIGNQSKGAGGDASPLLTQSVDNADKTNSYDVSELAYDISHTTSLLNKPGMLTFCLKRDPNKILNISLGAAVVFTVKGEKVFCGYVFTASTNKDETFNITAYDQMRYLKNCENFSMKDGEYTLKSLFEMLCSHCGMKHEVRGAALTDKTPLGGKVFVNKSYFDIFSWAIDEVNVKDTEKTVSSFQAKGAKKYTVKKGDTLGGIAITTGTTIAELVRINNITDPDFIQVGQVLYLTENKDTGEAEATDAGAVIFRRHFIKDEFGTLVLTDVKEEREREKRKHMDGELIIGDGSLLTNYEYNTSIDGNTYNEIVMEGAARGADKSGKQAAETLIRVVGRSDTREKWGLLRKIVPVNSGTGKSDDETILAMKDYAEMFLLNYANPARELRLEALGVVGLVAGSAFWLQLGKLDANVLMYAVSVTHEYSADLHTMSIDACVASGIKARGLSE